MSLAPSSFRIVSGDHVVQWAAFRLGANISVPCVHWGHEVNGKLAGVIVFSCYSGHDIEVSVAGEPKAWTRRFLRHVARYVFDTLGCSRVTVRTSKQDVAKLVLRLGGTIEGHMRDFYGPGKNAIALGILKDEWRLGR